MRFEYFIDGMHGDERKARGWARRFYRDEAEYRAQGNARAADIARACRAENEQVLVKRFKWSDVQLAELYAME